MIYRFVYVLWASAAAIGLVESGISQKAVHKLGNLIPRIESRAYAEKSLKDVVPVEDLSINQMFNKLGNLNPRIQYDTSPVMKQLSVKEVPAFPADDIPSSLTPTDLLSHEGFHLSPELALEALTVAVILAYFHFNAKRAPNDVKLNNGSTLYQGIKVDILNDRSDVVRQRVTDLNIREEQNKAETQARKSPVDECRDSR
jgi:hypothetical protein